MRLRYRMSMINPMMIFEPIKQTIALVWNKIKEYFEKMKMQADSAKQHLVQWSAKENQLLLEQYNKFPNNWARIADKLIHKDEES